MKPKRLIIKGLNSFVERQEIDFEKLTEREIFGIFGPTGSGKSTILDAITLALYGDISRNTNEFINSSVNSAFISYEFDIGLGDERKTYIVERNIKRNKKSGYRTSNATLRMISDKTEDVIAEGADSVKHSVEKIIGLISSDFTRSVMLPQGKFSEFLRLTGKDKRDMLERIFGLEKYGNELGRKIRRVKRKNQDEINILTGSLGFYKNISEEELKDKRKRHNIYILEEKQLKADLKRLQDDYDKYKCIWDLQNELHKFESRFKKLKENEDTIKEKEYILSKSKNAINIKPFIDILEETQYKIEENEKSLVKLNYTMDNVNRDFQLIKKEYDEICKQKEEYIPDLIREEANLSQAIEILKSIKLLQLERQKILNKYKEEDAHYKKIQSDYKLISSSKETLLKDVEYLEEKLKDVKVDPVYRQNVQEAFSIEKEYRDIIKDLEDINLKFEIKEKNINKIEKKYYIIQEKLKDNNIKMQGLEILIKNEINQVECKIQEIKKQKIRLQRDFKINVAGKLAEDLKKGDPCPVCGSTHHPSIAIPTGKLSVERNKKIDILESQEKQLEIKLASLNIEMKHICSEINSTGNQFSTGDLDELTKGKFIELKYETLKEEKFKYEKEEIRLLSELNNEKQYISEIQKEKAKVYKMCNEINIVYNKIMKELNLSNAKKELNKIKDYDIRWDNLQNQIDKSKNEINKLEYKCKKVESEIQHCEIDMARIIESEKERKGIINNKIREVDILSNGEDVKSYVQVVRKNINSINKKYKDLKIKLESATEEKVALSEKIFVCKQNRKSLIETLEKQDKLVENYLNENNFKSIDEVVNSLLSDKEIIRLEKLIEDYRDELKNVQLNMERINNKIGSQNIEKEKWEYINHKIIEKNDKVEQITKEIAVLSEEIKNTEELLKEYSKLKEQELKLRHKESLIDDIDTLVQGNKFVEFVANNQMKYIAFEASKMLKDITKGRYALELDDESNFVVRDDFNGGTIRPANTLSGGETFLTSLCLALALSSQIQLKGSAPLEFFFLDEGFGTLDSDSLDIVMDSLERLHSDNLCIGIISHVEELKNRVPIKIIVNPAEAGLKGSRVSIEYT